MLINNNIFIDDQMLGKIMQHLHVLIESQLALWDSEGRTIYGVPEEPQRFCSLIEDLYRDRKICYQCDKAAVKICQETLAPHSYVCHAGLSETVIPLIYENKIYLYLILGQYINADTEKQQRKIFVDYYNGKNVANEEIISEYNNTPKLSSKKVNAFIEIVQHISLSLWKNNIIEVNRNNLFLSVEKYIAENISSTLTVQSICERFFLSKNNLYRLFEEYCGFTVKKYITDKRLALAKELLASTNLTVAEIGDKVGAPNYGSFIHSFKNALGISPIKFRKLHKQAVQQ